MGFTLTGRATDLDLDVPTNVGLVVSAVAGFVPSGGFLRLVGAKGRFDAQGHVVKDVPRGEPDQPWVIAAPEGTLLQLKTSTFIGHFPPIQFYAPQDGSSVSLTDIVERTTPVSAPSPQSKYVRGASAYEIALTEGFVGTQAEWVSSLEGRVGDEGRSAYELAVSNGFVGTEEEWLASLVGPQALSLLPDPNLPGLYIMTGVPLTVDSDGLYPIGS